MWRGEVWKRKKNGEQWRVNGKGSRERMTAGLAEHFQYQHGTKKVSRYFSYKAQIVLCRSSSGVFKIVILISWPLGTTCCSIPPGLNFYLSTAKSCKPQGTEFKQGFVLPPSQFFAFGEVYLLGHHARSLLALYIRCTHAEPKHCRDTLLVLESFQVLRG